jgi:ABC-type uncharacterized transport system substrate-binding protein
MRRGETLSLSCTRLGEVDGLTSLAAQLIGLQVDIIVAYPTTAGIAVHQQATEIPIVVYGGDLEATKLERQRSVGVK